MKRFLATLRKGLNILAWRLRHQGLRTTLLWAYGRGVPFVTGVPMLTYGQVTPQLYVGSQHNLRGKRALERQGFDACVNMRVEKDDAALGLALAEYLHLPTVDDDAPSFEHLDRGAEFIHAAVQRGGKVYIHCGAGVGRAPTMAAAYLVSQGHSLEDALQMIRRARPFIVITPPQMAQLAAYAEAYAARQDGNPTRGESP